MPNPDDLYHIRRAATVVETSANRLGELARGNPDAARVRAEAAAAFAYLREDGGGDSDSFTMSVGRTVDEAQRIWRERAEAEGTTLVERIVENSAFVRGAAEAARPHRDVSNPAAVLLTQERWGAVRERLDAGRDLRSIVASADIATLVAVETFAPDWIDATRTVPRDLGDVHRADADAEIRAENIRTMIDERLAVIGDDHLRTVLQLDRRSAAFRQIGLTWAKVLTRIVSGTVGGGEDLDAAIAVTMLRQEAGIDPTPAERNATANGSLSAAASAEFATAPASI